MKWKSEQNGSDDEAMTMFAEFALRPLWDAYEGVSTAAACVEASSSGPGDAKIKADTPGMDSLLAAMQRGSTAPTANASDELHATPKTVSDVQRSSPEDWCYFGGGCPSGNAKTISAVE